MYVCDSYAFLRQLLFLVTCVLSVPCSVLSKKKLFDNVTTMASLKEEDVILLKVITGQTQFPVPYI